MALYKVYCDESRQTDSKYILVGGIWIIKDKGWDFVNDFEKFCKEKLDIKGSMGHMKWTKVPPKPEGKYFQAYKKLIDLYFDYNIKNEMSFRVLVADRDCYNFTHETYYQGDYEEGFYNLYCQLLLNWIQKENEYHIRVASRNVQKEFPEDCEEFRLGQLMQKVNKKLEMRLGRNFFLNWKPLVKTIESRKAKDRRLIQLADIFMGAVGFHWNSEHLKNNARPGKVELASYIASKLNRKSLCFKTEWNDNRFNIFYFDTSKSKNI